MDTKYDYEMIRTLREQGWEWAEIAVAHYPDSTSKQVRQAYHVWAKRQDGTDSGPGAPATGDEVTAEFDPSRGSLTAKGRKPLSLYELMEMSQLRREEWEVVKLRPGYSEVGTKHPESGAVTVTRLFNLQAHLKPAISTSALEAARDHVLAAISDRVGAARARPYALEHPPKDPKMAELALLDVHLGMLAWRMETGADWDLRIAEDTVKEATDGVLDEAAGQGVDHFIVPVGNDFFHTDATIQGKGGATTAGTPQDVDGRWQKAFTLGVDLMVWTVDRLLEIAPVKLLVVPGNHDRTKAWYLGAVLDAFYRNEPAVEIDNRPVPRKYHAYGNTLLGFCHGDGEKPADLPLLMAKEAPEAWGRSRFQEWHMGHWHHEITKEYKGVRCRYLPPITPADNWHVQKGYAGNVREATMWMWSLDRGLTSTFHHTVTPSPEQVEHLGPALAYVGTPTH